MLRTSRRQKGKRTWAPPHLVPVQGLEPGTHGLKIRCSPTELHKHNYAFLNSTLKRCTAVAPRMASFHQHSVELEGLIGAGDRTRTCDTWSTKPPFYQLTLHRLELESGLEPEAYAVRKRRSTN